MHSPNGRRYDTGNWDTVNTGHRQKTIFILPNTDYKLKDNDPRYSYVLKESFKEIPTFAICVLSGTFASREFLMLFFQMKRRSYH